MASIPPTPLPALLVVGATRPDLTSQVSNQGILPAYADKFAQRLHDAEIAATVSPTEAHADLERLGEEFALAVLTNGLPDWQRGKLAASDLDSYFNAVVTSFDVGAHKPDPEPFREVERRIDADGYAMIGDSDDDVDGAEAAGWESLRYDGGRLGDVPA
ncbi:hypothetical protein BRC69_04640, partial [Halobacteriales archaeon QH_6_66_25]